MWTYTKKKQKVIKIIFQQKNLGSIITQEKNFTYLGREMVQWFRAYAGLVEDLGSISGTHVTWLRTTFKGSDTSSGPLGTSTHMLIQTQTKI